MTKFEAFNFTLIAFILAAISTFIHQSCNLSITIHVFFTALPLGPNLAPYYVVEMAEYPSGDWFEVYEEVRGITCDINGLTPLRDYRFRVSVRNRFGMSDPSPYSVGHR